MAFRSDGRKELNHVIRVRMILATSDSDTRGSEPILQSYMYTVIGLMYIAVSMSMGDKLCVYSNAHVGQKNNITGYERSQDTNDAVRE